MNSHLNGDRHNKLSSAVFLILLGLNFSLPVTTAYADLPISKTRTLPKTWIPPRAAGKPEPYIAPSGQGIIMSSGASKLTKNGQSKSPAGRPISSSSSNALGPAEQMVLQSRDISSYGPVWQSFSDYLTVAKGCDKAPFSLAFTNGSGSSPRFQDLRIRLAGKSLATIKDFNGQPKLVRNLTGAIGAGDSLLVVQVYGPAGAQLNWQFTTPKVEIVAVAPKNVALNKTIMITGKNFSEQASANQVYFDKTLVPVVSASKTQIQVKVPGTLVGGKADLIVAVGPSRSKPYKITVKSAPKISSVNMISTAPGQPLTITGEGFSANTGDNQVYFGDVLAQIVSCTATSITVIVPEPPDGVSYPDWGLPVKVKTNGVDSVDPDGRGTINIQSRVF